MSDNELILNRAKAAVLSRDFALAARLYKTLLRTRPQDTDLLAQLGALYIKSGNDAQALPVFKEIIALDPGNRSVLNELGGIYRRLKQYPESVAVLEQALAMGNNDIQISYNLGFTYKLMGKYEDAIACFEDVVSQNPSDVLAFNHMGAIYALQGDHDKAVSSYERGLKIDPNHPILQFNIARSFEALGKNDKALTAYETALRSKPGWLEAIDGYTHLLLKLDRTREAADVVHQAIRLNPKDVKMHTRLGSVYSKQNNFSGAKEEYSAALKTEEQYEPALVGLANAQEQLGETDGAVQTIQKVEALKPDDSEVLKKSAHILLSANHLNAALQRLRTLQKKKPDDLQTLNLFGQYAICAGDETARDQYYKKINSINPMYYDHYRDGAGRYQQVGKLVDAEKYLRAYLSKKSNDPAALALLGAVKESLGNTDEALSLYHKALGLDSDNQKILNSIQAIEKRQAAGKKEDVPAFLQEAAKDANADFEATAAAEIALDADDSQFEKPEDAEPEEKQTDEQFDFDQFGMENLTNEEPLDPLIFNDIEDSDEDLPIDETEDLDDLVENDEPIDDEPIDEGTPTEADDSAEMNGSPVFEDEPVGNEPSSASLPSAEPVPENDTVPEESAPASIPPAAPVAPAAPEPEKEPVPPVSSPAQNPVPGSDIQSAGSDDQNRALFEKQLSAATDAVEKAQYAAQHAWDAAQMAADSAQEAAAAAACPSRQNEDPAADLSPVDQDEPEEAAAAPAEEETLETDEYAKDTALFEKAVNMLPSIVNILVDRDMIEKFKPSLEMFKKLRGLSEYLPPDRKEAFLSSHTRLLLDYIIERLSGKPGLLATAEALRRSGMLTNVMPPRYPVSTGVDLAARVLGDMRSYISSLPDLNLGNALDSAVEDALKKI